MHPLFSSLCNGIGLLSYLLLTIDFLQAQQVLSVEEAIALGLKNNYQIQILRSNELIAKNNNSAANADFLPTVGVNGAYSFTSTNTQQEFFNGETRSASAAGSRNANASLQANWTIFDGFRRQALRQALTLEESRTSEITRAQVLQLIQQIELAYYQIAQQQQLIGLTNQSIELNEAVLTLAHQKQQIGAGSQSEVLQASNQLNTDSILLIQQQGEFDRLKIDFNRLVQRPLDENFAVIDSITLEPLPPQAEMVQEALNQNPNLLLARIDQESAALKIQEIKSVLYPKLSLNAAYNYNFSKAEVGFLLSNRTFGPTGRATITYDLFSGRNLKRELQNVDLQLDNLQLDQQQIQWDIESQITSLYTEYNNLLELRRAEEKNIQIAEQNSLLAQELYRTGRNTSFEVREAILREIQAKDRLLQSTYHLKFIEIQLKTIAGSLVP